MGFKTTSTRFTAARSAQSSDTVAYNNVAGGTSVGGSGVTASTVISSVVTTPGSAPVTTTSVANGPTIANIQYLDANNAIVSGLAAVSTTTGGNILITGTGFVANSLVYVNNILVSNTVLSSTQIQAICGAASSGNVAIMIFAPSLTGTVSPSGVRYSGVPTWTTAAIGLQNNAASNVQLIASSDSTITYTLQAGSTLPTGMSLVSSGYISGTPTGYSNNATTSVVVIATDRELQSVQQTISITVSVADPKFPQTTLLLTGDAGLNTTNAATNSTFIDSGPSNVTVTRAGNATQGSFSPYSPTGWSYYCPTASYVKFPANANYAFAGNFTIEAWINMDITSGGPYTVFGMRSSTLWFDFRYYSGNWQVSYNTGSGTNMGGTMTAGAWTHVALVRNSGVLSVYVNGVATGTTVSNATTLGFSTAIAGVGSDGNGSNQFIGYISNLRVVNGTAVYTSNFTPATAPLTAIANTVLLTAQSNRFTDTSAIAASPTVAGTPSVQATCPFSPATTTIGGSVYLDGTGDYLTVPASSAYSATGDVTIEVWSYSTSQASTSYILDIYSTPTLGIGSLQVSIQTTGVIKWYYDATASLTTTLAVIPNSWNHIACVRSGSTLKIYVNGVADAATATFSGLIGRADLVPYIGSNRSPANYVFGYLSDFRFTKAALYSANFSLSTAPLTNPSPTSASLLLNFANGGIIDAHSSSNLETVGSTQLSTSVYKYGTASVYFNGTASYLQSATNNTALAFTTGDFTVECWVNFATNNGTYNPFVRYDGTGTFDFGYDFSVSQLKYSGAASIFAVSQTFTVGTWYHVALTRASGSSRLFVNGTQIGTTVSGDTNSYAVGAFKIGGSNFSAAHVMSGYLDDVRITKGFARYTANFTPPTTGSLTQ